MPKAELTQVVWPRCQKVADQLGFELVDVCLDRENTGKYLRIYLDRPEGMDLDSCEKYPRAIQPLVEDYDYDFLEVSSPGLDRPIKRDRDFERAIGEEVEVHLYRPVEDSREWTGTLVDFDRDRFTVSTQRGDMVFERKACSLIKPLVDMTGVEEVDLSEEDLSEGELSVDETDGGQ